ncbi:MAG: TonB-dependent receptor [Verrucomicrobiaceae bacterium]
MKKIGFSLTAAICVTASGQDSLAPLTVVGEKSEAPEGLTAEELEIFQTDGVKRLLGQVPGFGSVASDSAGYGDTLAIRGTANTAFFGPAGVAMVVDDVPYGDVYTYSTDFFDLQSAQVHRGPQGAYFGRNGAGGLLELNTAGPTDEAYYKFTAEYGSYEHTALRFLASGPLSEQLSYTFQTYYNEREGYIGNVVTGQDVDYRERFGALANLYYRPSADLELRFRAMVETARDGGQRLTNLPGLPGPFGVGGFLPQSPFQVASDIPGATGMDRYQFSFHVTQDLGWATLKSISSVQQWELGPNLTDLDFSSIPGAFSSSDIRQNQDYFTQEFRLESDADAALRWQTGLFLSRNESDGDATRVVPTGFPAPFDRFTSTTSFDSKRDTLALYGTVAWDQTDRLSWELGGRLEHVDSEMMRANPAVVALPFTGQADDWYFSPTLGLSYKATDATTLFARTSLGIKPAGYTAFSDDPATFGFGEETAWETEVGVRIDCPDENWDLELRGYFKKIDDYQLNRSTPTGNFIVLNAEEVHAVGIEAEANWRPVENLTINASAGWSQVEFERFIDGPTNLSGNRVPFIPELTASLGFRYDIGNGFYVSSALRVVGSTQFDDFESPQFEQSSYQLVDAEIGYEAENWNAVVFGRNILDEGYYSFMNPQISAGAPGDPGMVGVRVGVEF